MHHIVLLSATYHPVADAVGGYPRVDVYVSTLYLLRTSCLPLVAFVGCPLSDYV